MNRRLKITIPVFLAVICILCLAVTGILKNSSDMNDEFISDTVPSDVSDEYNIIQEKTGLYGVKDENDNEIISAEWNSITPVSNDNFIVSRKSNGSELFGMIDCNENIVAALAYESLVLTDQNVIIGKPAESTGYLLIKPDGSFYTDTFWDSYEISGKDITLSKNRSNYYAEFENNEIKFKSFRLLRSSAGISFSFSGDFLDYIGNIPYKTVEEMADVSAKYIEAVACNDSIAVRNTTTSEYYSNIIPSEYMGMEIQNIYAAVISINNSDGTTSYQTSMKIDYLPASEKEVYISSQYTQTSSSEEPVYTETTEKKQRTADFKITMEKNSDGFMIVKSVYYIG